MKIVFASTRQIYGRPEYLPVDETAPARAGRPNGINKAAGEGFHLLYGRCTGCATSVLRLTNTYGPRMRVKDDRQTFLGTWLRLAVEGEELLVFGDGTQQRDFTYVDDAVEAFLLAGSRDEADGEIFNVGGAEPPISLRELAGARRVRRYRLVPFPDERKPIDIGDYYADDRKLRERLGWEPRSACARGSRGRSSTTASTARRRTGERSVPRPRAASGARPERAELEDAFAAVLDARPVRRRAGARALRGGVRGVLRRRALRSGVELGDRRARARAAGARDRRRATR